MWRGPQRRLTTRSSCRALTQCKHDSRSSQQAAVRFATIISYPVDPLTLCQQKSAPLSLSRSSRCGTRSSTLP